jgi:hypothetical protein
MVDTLNALAHLIDITAAIVNRESVAMFENASAIIGEGRSGKNVVAFINANYVVYAELVQF